MTKIVCWTILLPLMCWYGVLLRPVVPFHTSTEQLTCIVKIMKENFKNILWWINSSLMAHLDTTFQWTNYPYFLTLITLLFHKLTHGKFKIILGSFHLWITQRSLRWLQTLFSYTFYYFATESNNLSSLNSSIELFNLVTYFPVQ